MSSTALKGTAQRAMRWAIGLGIALIGSVSLAGSASYTYDSLGRLTEIRYSNGVYVVYYYDAAGNRTSFVVAGAPS